MRNFELARPTSVAQAREMLAERPGAIFKAGGIDVLDHLKEHLVEPPQDVVLHRARQGVERRGVDRVAARVHEQPPL